MCSIHHIGGKLGDLDGNKGKGRYVFIPGSDFRAKWISDYFFNTKVIESTRGHKLYLGQISSVSGLIDVASVSTGMGPGSLEIVLSELFKIGGKKFIRIGTAGSLQPDLIKVPSIVVATSAVRDDFVSNYFAPLEVPSIATVPFLEDIRQASLKMDFKKSIFFGMVHSKAALYSRELGEGPLGKKNLDYMSLMNKLGVIASEMETATLFIMGQSKFGSSYNLVEENDNYLFGSILAIIGDKKAFSQDKKLVKESIGNAIQLAIESVKINFEKMSN